MAKFSLLITKLESTLLIFIIYLMVACPLSFAASFTSPFINEAPNIEPPKEANLKGELGNFSLKAPEIYKGQFTVKLPLELPTKLGPLLADVIPVYSSGTGLTEWGQGWGVDLTIKRYRHRGVVSFDDEDSFLSPFGELVYNSRDHYYYPKSLKEKIKFDLSLKDQSRIMAYHPDGRVFKFGVTAREEFNKGIQSWYLEEVKSAKGEKTILQYEKNESGRHFLKTVFWGVIPGTTNTFLYRLDFNYYLNDFPYLIYYQYGERRTLDRRVENISLHIKQQKNPNGWTLKSEYEIEYAEASMQLAFNLFKVTKTNYSSDGSKGVEPSYQYNYNHPLFASLDKSYWKELTYLTPLLYNLPNGYGVFSPQKSAFYDEEDDGYIDIEYSVDFSVLSLRRGNFNSPSAPLDPPALDIKLSPPLSSVAYTGCVQKDIPRKLYHLRGPQSEIEVVHSSYNMANLTTTYHICSRSGEASDVITFNGNWSLSNSNVKFIDINNDQRPDLLKVEGNRYTILINESTSDHIYLGSGGSSIISGELTSWQNNTYFTINDLNGDGNPDIIALIGGRIAVWPGSGDLRAPFISEPYYVTIKNRIGLSSPLAETDTLNFFDANGDGLSDLLLIRSGKFSLLINTGLSLIEEYVPALASKNGEFFLSPNTLNLSGEGDPEINVIQNDKVYNLKLVPPNNALLNSVLDGKGNKISIEYGHAPNSAYSRKRAIIFSKVTVEAAGYGSISKSFSFQNPAYHSEYGTNLLGFGRVEEEELNSVSLYEFLNSDEVSGLLTKSIRYDKRFPSIQDQKNLTYENFSLGDLSSLRLHSEEESLADTQSLSSSKKETTYTYTTNNICLAGETTTFEFGKLNKYFTYDNPADLQNHHTCFQKKVTLEGIHEDHPSFNFTHEINIARNGVGLPIAIYNRDLLLQKNFYDSASNFYRLLTSYTPEKGINEFAYETGKGRLRSIKSRNGHQVGVSLFDDYNDNPAEIETLLGDNNNYYLYLRYDSFDRLFRSWSNESSIAIYGDYDKEYIYIFPTLENPSLVLHKEKIFTGGDFKDLYKATFNASNGKELGSVQNSNESDLLFSGLKKYDPKSYEEKNYPLIIPQSGDLENLKLSYQNLDEIFTTPNFAALKETRSSALSSLLYEKTKYSSSSFGEFSYSRSVDPTTNFWKESILEDGEFRKEIEGATGASKRISFRDEEGKKYLYSYDVLDRLREIGMPSGKVKHSISYNSYGQINKIDRTDVGSISYEYDRTSGLLSKRTVKDKWEESRSYDQDGRITSKQFTSIKEPSLSKLNYTYSYDGVRTEGGVKSFRGQKSFLTEVKSDNFIRTMLYSKSGKLEEELLKIGGQVIIQSKDTYLEGRILVDTKYIIEDKKTKYHKSMGLSYGYNNIGLLSEVSSHCLSAKDGKLCTTPFLQISYNNKNLVSELHFLQKKIKIRYTYDEETSVKESIEYLSDDKQTAFLTKKIGKRGLIEGETSKSLLSIQSKNYLYTPNKSLKGTSTESAQKLPDENFIYSLDNILNKDVLNQSIDQGYLVRKGDLSLSYLPNGRLGQLSKGSDVTAEYSYNEEGEILFKKKKSDIVEVYNSDYTYLNDLGFYIKLKINNEIVALVNEKDVIIPLFDFRQTLLSSDSTKTINQHLSYGNFQTRVDRPAFSRLIDYATGGYDVDLGAVRMKHRFYDPERGLFISPDPLFLEIPEKCIDSPIECNLYSYAGNNPINYFDPFGLELKPIELLGKGNTYLDDKFSPKIQDWIQKNTVSGVDTKITEAFRTTSDQKDMTKNLSAITPAKPGTSLHEAGFAVDITRSYTKEQFDIIVKNAKEAGLKWGGDLSKPDVVHFFSEPGQSRTERSQYIEDAQKKFIEIKDLNKVQK